MIPAWTVLIPAALLLASMVLAFQTRPRALALLGALLAIGVVIVRAVWLIRW